MIFVARAYIIDDQDGMYFLTFRIVDWVDVFTREIYCQEILESFRYCRENKGLRLHAYVIMSNHLHVIMSAENNNLTSVLRDFKRHTANRIWDLINKGGESRRDWLLDRFQEAAHEHDRNSNYQIWHHDNHAIELVSYKFTLQKLAYIHLNPVRAGYVLEAAHWKYSSQRNYDGDSSILNIDLLDY